MEATVIMAIVTARYFAVLQFLVTVDTIQLAVDFIKLQSSNAVAEVLLVPATVAIGTFTAEFADFSTGRMTGATTQALMKPVEYPVAVTGVSESRFLSDIVALVTGIASMTVITDSVYFLVRFVDARRFFQVVAVTTVFLGMAVNTTKSKQVDMLLVMKSHHRSLPVGRGPDSHLRHRDNGVRDTKDIS
jgi:hypothetical protein